MLPIGEKAKRNGAAHAGEDKRTGTHTREFRSEPLPLPLAVALTRALALAVALAVAVALTRALTLALTLARAPSLVGDVRRGTGERDMG